MTTAFTAATLLLPRCASVPAGRTCELRRSQFMPATRRRAHRGATVCLDSSPKQEGATPNAEDSAAPMAPLNMDVTEQLPPENPLPNHTPTQQADSEQNEEPLDEAAMRAAELHDVIVGLKDFKGRIIDDATKLAKKVRAPKKQLDAALASHPDLLKIDGHITDLEAELRALGDR